MRLVWPKLSRKDSRSGIASFVDSTPVINIDLPKKKPNRFTASYTENYIPNAYVIRPKPSIAELSPQTRKSMNIICVIWIGTRIVTRKYPIDKNNVYGIG